MQAGHSQFRLLRERRFFPYFSAQAFGAFNDNLLRNGLVILATYQTAQLGSVDAEVLVNIIGGLFVLPFLLFSGMAGQLADRFDKALILKTVKAFEIGIMVLAGYGFGARDLSLLLTALFLMGLHSTFFAPAKYGLLPQVLRPSELIGGNALVEMGTFLAILSGTLTAGILAARTDAPILAYAMLAISILGFLVSLAIPKLPAAAPGTRIDWNPWSSTLDNLRAARESKTVFLSLLGLSWFWFYGALVLAQLPVFARSVLNGTEQVVTVMLVVFSVGVGIGSLLCERLSGRKVEIGLVPFGSIGLSAFALDLAIAAPEVPAIVALNAEAFLQQPGSVRILIDLLGAGLFGGFYVVPLYAMVQQRSRPEALSRVIGANSILNALFMIAAALLGAAVLAMGYTVVDLLFLIAALNLTVALYIYSLVPEFLLRFVSWLLVHTIYQLDVRDAQNIPEEGPALLLCNHVSFVDALVISAATRRPIRFIMDSAIFNAPVIKMIARGMKAVPIASAKSDAEIYEQAFATVAEELRQGQLVCIFPEGRLTADGVIGPFRPGMMRILAETPVPVIPLAISGLWGSMFSRFTPVTWLRMPRKLFARITIIAGTPVRPPEVTPEGMRDRVQALLAGP